MRNFEQSSGAELMPGRGRDGGALVQFDATGMIATGAGGFVPVCPRWRGPGQEGASAGEGQWLASLERWQGGAVRA